MANYYVTFDGREIDFGFEICDRLQKFLTILEKINNHSHIHEIILRVFDNGFSFGSFYMYFREFGISFHLKSNKIGYRITFEEITGIDGNAKADDLKQILEISSNFCTTIKKERYAHFEKVIKNFCETMNITCSYYVGE